jgi:hypothetical protein
MKTKASNLPKATLTWFQNNPIKAVIVSVFGTLGVPALINTLFQEIFVPALMPLNIITNVSTVNPSRKEVFALNGNRSLSPIELQVGIKNPGKRKIYLLRSVWTAEICKLAPKSVSPEVEKASLEDHDGVQFSNDLEQNNNPWQAAFPTTFLGFERLCKFIGMGNLITDNSVSPDEEINSRILIVYPGKISFYPGSEKESPDYIRVNTIVPSTTYKQDDLSYKLLFKKLNKAPRGIQLWKKREQGRLVDGCSFDTRMLKGKTFEPKQNQLVRSSATVQVWCKLSPEEANRQGVVLTQSTHETWLTDRK